MYKILIWGTGQIANTLLKHLNNAQVIGFIESVKKSQYYNNLNIYLPNELPEKYDFIVVANSHSSEIMYICHEMGIDLDKVVFLREAKINPGCSSMKIIRELFDEYQYTMFCTEHSLLEDTFFEHDAEKYSNMNQRLSFQIDKSDLWPVINEKYAKAGQVNNYFLQDLWAAKLISKSGVKSHFDIGSRLDGFIAHLLSMNIDVTMIDVREFPCEIEGLKTIVADATLLDGIEDNSIDSLSALCSLEHFGLGRYGDPVDPEACFKCFRSISRKMMSGGKLYISVPVGRERVEFNAHRVFSPRTIISEFPDFELNEYACAAEGKVEHDIDLHKYDDDPHNGEYRYGLFYFVKK